MKIFTAMLLLSLASPSSEAVKAVTLKTVKACGFPRLSQQAPSREIANALDQLNCRNDPMCFIRAARSLAERGEQLDLALACVERAGTIPAEPNDAVPRESFFLTYAYVQIKRREFDRAIATLTRGAQYAPEYARLDEYLIYLGLAYENAGRIDEAIETYVTLAGGLKDISDEPSERLVALYLKRYGSLRGLKEEIEYKRLRARKKFFVYNHLLSMPAPGWSLQDLDGRQVSLSDFSKKILVLTFVSAGGNSHEPLLRFLQAQYEKYKDRGVAFVFLDDTEKPDPKAIKIDLERMGVTIPTLTDSAGVAKQYQTVQPLIVLIDEKGMIRFENSVWQNYQPFVTEQIQFLVAEKEK